MKKSRKTGGLYRLIYKEGTHLAPSKDTKGAYRGTLLDDESEELAGQSEWLKVDESEHIYDMDNGWLSNSINEEPSPEEEVWIEILGAMLAAGTIWIIDEFIAPRVRNWWKERVTPIIQGKGKLKIKRIRTKRVKEGDASHHERALYSNVDIYNIIFKEFEYAHEEYLKDISSEEAQRELMDIFILLVILISKIRKLSGSRIVADNGNSNNYLKGQEIVEKLFSEKYFDSINDILAKNVILLEEKSNILTDIFGFNIIENDKHVPIEVDKIKDKILNLDSNYNEYYQGNGG